MSENPFKTNNFQIILGVLTLKIKTNSVDQIGLNQIDLIFEWTTLIPW